MKKESEENMGKIFWARLIDNVAIGGFGPGFPRPNPTRY